MKKLMLVLMAVVLADALAGCIVVPEHHAERSARVYVY
ncbi:hypothetical protein BRPE64_ACDS07100 [Caballeronia insecticola]|uniref:Uncharacterized protein n=1 Tax=Caballeronia insecticola TaxID=758793 RepID=R4WFU3_9BURK|nr:hypothetical protein BRPE64_ACDS07100 [Caballeronia insecticola]